MHDDLLERRLRAALHHEADDLPFTITAAKLERRLALRGRLTAGRRAAWLLAATVGIGLLGLGATLGGLADDPTRSPGPTAAILTSPRAPQATGPTNLGTLDELIAHALGDEIAIAHAHDWVDVGGGIPAGVLPDRVSVELGTIEGSTRYQLEFACLGGGVATLDVRVIRVPGGGVPISGPDVDCDGAFHAQPIDADGPRQVSLTAPRTASWRIVVSRLEGPGSRPVPVLAPIELQPGEEVLVSEEDRSALDGGRPDPDAPGHSLQDLGVLSGRNWYRVRASCVGATAVRHIVGNDVNGTSQAFITTLVPCDDSVHETFLQVPQPFGASAFVSASPEARWSIVVSSEQPPISIAEDQPGWQRQVAFGPHLSFDPTEHGFSAPGVEGGGPVLIVFACAGPSPIDVTVDVGAMVGKRQETFTAACLPDGAETGQTFDVRASNVDLTYAAPVGTWTAISILVPDPLPAEG